MQEMARLNREHDLLAQRHGHLLRCHRHLLPPTHLRPNHPPPPGPSPSSTVPNSPHPHPHPTRAAPPPTDFSLRPLSEKMKPGEDLRDAALRALREELGSLVAGKRVHIVVPGSSSPAKVEERPSASYLGLLARYVLHSVDAYVEGLPDGEFWTEEEGEEKDSGKAAVYVKKHFWKWVNSDASNPSSSSSD